MLMLLAILALPGCGGSSGDQPATGDVTVIFTDGPTDKYQRVLLSITGMSLIGAGGHVTLYDGPEITFDLLDMSEWGDFAFNTKALAGRYHKVRLEVSRVQLMDMTTDETVLLDKLPAGGMIDLNARGQFDVSPDHTTVIKLDVDAQRSFHDVLTGNGKIEFRPIVFIDVFEGDIFLPDRLVRVFGSVDADSIEGADTVADPTDDSLRLCNLEFISQTDGPTVTGPSDCIRVYAGASPGIFDSTGAEAAFADIGDGDPMTAVGFLVSTDDTAAFLGLNSVVLEIGDRQPTNPSGWATIQGVVDTDPVACTTDTGQCFDFDPDETDPAETVRMQAGTRVFRADGTELTQADVTMGDTGSIDAVPGATDLHAALVVLASDSGSGLVSGTLDGLSTNGAYPVIEVMTGAGELFNVCVDTDTSIVQVLMNDDTVTIFDILDPSVLEVGSSVEAYGDTASPPAGCDMLATQVIVEPPVTP